ncbi:MAG: YraN family protein [Candidatus Sumerlaeota bacterium]|nr:YraN family protein [Candidatus Sumerlaeota bacterium]
MLRWLRNWLIRRGWMADWQTNDHLLLGRQGEALAARYLRRQGMRILRRNYSDGSWEIDLIASEGETVVFVEVKTRQNVDFGAPETAVDIYKQDHIRAAAQHYLKRLRRARELPPFRFDIVAIDCSHKGQKPVVNHIRRAF